MSASIKLDKTLKPAAKLSNVIEYDFASSASSSQPLADAFLDSTIELSVNNDDKGLVCGIPFFIQRVMGLLILLAISPILLLAVLTIRFESRGAAFFTQTRVGYQGRQFAIYKLRSMYQKDDPKYQEPDAATSDRDGVCAKYFNDPRITKVGKWIRKLSIDELPQLINVIRGEMLLIGPRPALIKEVDAYQFEQLERLNCMPGMTGLWQVSGRADTSFAEQMQLDIDYVKGVSLWLDIKILFATVPAVLLAKGAY